jgi:hypothetical protein
MAVSCPTPETPRERALGPTTNDRMTGVSGTNQLIATALPIATSTELRGHVSGVGSLPDTC